MEMQYDFDTPVDRRGSGASKWEMMYGKKTKVETDVVPLSVADMEFMIAPEIREALHRYLDTYIPGYSTAPEGYLESVCRFLKQRHDLDVKPEMMVQTPGVVFALGRAVETLTKAEEGVIIFTPVYYPFYRVIQSAERRVVRCPLRYEEGRYTIDFALFEQLAAENENTALMLCSPHNPVGRVWTEEEIRHIAEICEKYGLSVIADEIHFDLVYPGHPHFSFGKIGGSVADRTILCTAPSKTFNLAGMNLSNIIIRNTELRRAFRAVLQASGIPGLNPFGYVACRAAYDEGEGWLDALISYLDGNRRYVSSFIEENLPQIRVVPLEGTYLQWLDCTALGLSKETLEQLMEQNDLFLDEGYLFGEEGEGFERINLACPRSILENAMQRLKNAVEAIS